MAVGSPIRVAPSPRVECATHLQADTKLAHDTRPSRVDARATMSYAVQHAIGTNADDMDRDYFAQRTRMRAAQRSEAAPTRHCQFEGVVFGGSGTLAWHGARAHPSATS